MVENLVITYILFVVVSPIVGYLFGSLNASIILSKATKKRDIRELESKNAGATNMIRVYGRKIGLIAMFLDIIKPILLVSTFYLIYKYALGSVIDFYSGFDVSILVYLGGVFVIIGHCFPIFFKFKGGKGVSCFGGLLIVINPIVAVIGIILILIILKISKYMSLSSMLSAAITTFLVLIPGINYIPFYHENFVDYFNVIGFLEILYDTWYVTLFLLISASLLIYAHKQNIYNISTKKERLTFISKKDKKAYEDQQIIKE